MAGCRTRDQKVVRWTLGQLGFKWLLLGRVTVCRQLNHFSI